jgi:hypothetical protein
VDGKPFVATLGNRPEHLPFARLGNDVDILDTEAFACSQDGADIVVLVKVLENQGYRNHTVCEHLLEALETLGEKIRLEEVAIRHIFNSGLRIEN